MAAIRVLIVDDSAVLRQVLSGELSRDSDIEVVGTAPDPYVARDFIVTHKPDVVTLDVEMPRMDGITFLRKLMHYHPVPVIVLSSLTPAGGELAMEALSLGAFDVLSKSGSSYTLGDVGELLRERIRAAACVNVQQLASMVAARGAATPGQARGALAKTTNKIIALGASTGGTTAIEQILTRMPGDLPGTIITQHMPPGLTGLFAKRLNGLCELEVREAVDGDAVVPGVALIAPGNRHLLLKRSGARYIVSVKDGPLVNSQRPSVDVMFQSVARTAGKSAIGVILSGMGADGASGLLDMRNAGARTIGQDEASCVVYGMPKMAARAGAVEEEVSLERIPDRVLDIVGELQASS